MQPAVNTPGPKKLPDSVLSRQKKFEILWRALFVVVTLFMMLLVHKIYLFHTLEQFAQHKKGHIWDLLLHCLPIALAFIALEHFMHSKLDGWVERNYLRTDKYIDKEARMRKSFSIAKWQYSGVYYTITSVVGYLLIRGTSFMPGFLGGSGSIYSLADTRYLEEATEGMRWFYIVQTGKHVGRIISHVLIRPEGSYYEYLLHHSLSVFLIFFSWTMDMWVIGIFVLILHDASDVFLSHCRALREYRYRNETFLKFSYVMLFVSWVGLRIISFGYCCVYAVWYQCLYRTQVMNPVETHVFLLPYYFMAFMLTCLLVMHIYWMYYILESFLATSTAEKAAKHSYD